MLAEVPTANVSYKKQVFEEMRPFLSESYCSDSEFHWRLHQAGYTILFNPMILVFHQSIDRFLPFLNHEYVHGRDFARVRSRYQGFSKFKKTIYTCLFFLIPVKLIALITWRNLSNRSCFKQFIKSFPLMCLGVISWSIGEGMGYLKQKRV